MAGGIEQIEQEALRDLSATALRHAARLPASSPWRDVCQEAHSVFAESAAVASSDRPGRLQVIEGGRSQGPAPAERPAAGVAAGITPQRVRWSIWRVAAAVFMVVPLPVTRAELWHHLLGYV